MQEIDEVGNVHDRIVQMVDYFGKGNKAAFGRIANIQSGVLAGIIGGRKNKPSFEVLQKILTGYPTVNPTWLLFGRGEMLTEVQSSPTYEETHPHRPRPDGSVTIMGLPMSKEMWDYQKAEYEQRQRAQAKHERVVTVLLAMVDYMSKTNSSNEFTVFKEMVQDALNPPLTEAQEDAMWEQRMDEYHAQESAEWERQRQEREGKQEGKQ